MTQTTQTEIKIGTQVRSFDFEHRTDCFIDGIVEEIGEVIEGCPRYRILVTRQVFSGEERDEPKGGYVFPPVNGTPTFGGTTAFVQAI